MSHERAQFIETEALLLALEATSEYGREELEQYLRANFLDGELRALDNALDRLGNAIIAEQNRRR